MPRYRAMGLIETRGLIACIEAADAAAKTAHVHFLRMEKVDASLVSIRFVGETAAVQAATSAGAEAARRIGHLVAVHVIPRLDEATVRMLGMDTLQEPTVTSPITTPKEAVWIEYHQMSVQVLRSTARSLPDFPLKGRELTRLDREQLIESLVRYQEARRAEVRGGDAGQGGGERVGHS